MSTCSAGTTFAGFAAFAAFATGCTCGFDGALEQAASASATSSPSNAAVLAQRIGASSRSTARGVHGRCCCGSGGGSRGRRAIRVTVDRAEEAGADLRLGVAAGHQLGEAREALLDPAVVEALAAHQLEILLVQLD